MPRLQYLCSKQKRKEGNLLSMFKGASFPWREGSHGLENDTSTCSSVSTTTLKVVALILPQRQFLSLCQHRYINDFSMAYIHFKYSTPRCSFCTPYNIPVPKHCIMNQIRIKLLIIVSLKNKLCVPLLHRR